MTARIRELPEFVCNQIAAGEVVERPASVVKELVENALDAGATEIQIDLEEGGVRLVRVKDDGAGMGPEDLALCFRSHATSKLADASDLAHIASLGFRGEALPSIGSVARARIVSRPPGAALGHTISNDGGRLSEVTEAGAEFGTTVEVRDLFFNTPARRNFLKRASTELARALDFVQRLALAHVGVGFVLTHDGARVFDVERSMDLRQRIRRTFGSDLEEALEPVEAEDGTTRVVGFVAPPRHSRRDTSRQMWFLNGRPLRDKILTRILRQAYHGFLVDGRQPIAFLALVMDPAAVDVNVHPTKTEVRFRDERRLFGFLVAKLREAIAATDMATPGDTLLRSAAKRGGWQESAGQARLPDPGALRGTAPRASAAFAREARPMEPPSVREVPGRAWQPPSAASGRGADGVEPAPSTDTWARRDELRGPFLQVAKTYLVRALPDGFEIVDQHALHERLTYEGLRAQVREGRIEVQRLLAPDLVEVSRAEVRLIEGHLDALAAIGLELAIFGPSTIAVHGLPALLRRPNAEGLVNDVIAILEKTGKAPTADEVVEEVLHSAACRSSIMAGDELDESEIRALLERAGRLESDQTCPHARPTRVRFTLEDLEKAFHRR
ncbi:MAG: DNA mismatch repair endonuclease MutL [Planctomycetota bacterium]